MKKIMQIVNGKVYEFKERAKTILKNERGDFLADGLVVIGIVGIVALIVVPNLKTTGTSITNQVTGFLGTTVTNFLK